MVLQYTFKVILNTYLEPHTGKMPDTVQHYRVAVLQLALLAMLSALASCSQLISSNHLVGSMPHSLSAHLRRVTTSFGGGGPTAPAMRPALSASTIIISSGQVLKLTQSSGHDLVNEGLSRGAHALRVSRPARATGVQVDASST